MTTWDRNSEGAWRAEWRDADGIRHSRTFYFYSKRDAARQLAQYRREQQH